jgi:hypothetical protein
MAVITIALSALVWGGLLYALAGKKARYLWCIVLGLPLSPVVNLLIKQPALLGLARLTGTSLQDGLRGDPLAVILAVALLAPLTEEAIKLTPLLIGPVQRWSRDQAGALWVGLGLGIGFGLGEAIFVAYQVAQAPEYAAFRWFVFTGYAFERFLVTLGHGALTAIAASGWQRGSWRLLWGYLSAVALHLLLNAGAILAQVGVIGIGLASLTMPLALGPVVIVFEILRRRAHPSIRWE